MTPFAKNLGPRKFAGTDFGNVCVYAVRIDRFGNRMDSRKFAGADFENVWVYAGLHGAR